MEDVLKLSDEKFVLLGKDDSKLVIAMETQYIATEAFLHENKRIVGMTVTAVRTREKMDAMDLANVVLACFNSSNEYGLWHS